jgi:hypothetical protein
MTLEELLHELRTNLLQDTSDIAPGGEDVRQYTDVTLLRYIKDAEARFSRSTGVLRDSNTPSLTRIALVEGKTDYPVNKAVHSVLSARYDTDTHDLSRSTHNAVNSSTQPQEFSIERTVAGTAISPGRPIAYWTDESQFINSGACRVLSVYPAPSAAEVDKILSLRVVRVPTTNYDSDHLDEESQMPDHYQLSILNWAAYRALRGFDSDKGSRTEADRFKTDFEEAVEAARIEVTHSLGADFKVQYGQNGFTWD